MTKVSFNRVFKIIGITLGVVLIALCALALFFNSKVGQKKLSNLVFSQLSSKIGTPIQGKLRFSIPDWISLDDLLVLDQKSDTLLYAQKAHVDVALFQLLNNKLIVEQVRLENAKATILKKDGAFNFNYIINAFASKDTSTQVDTSSASMKMILDKIDIKNVAVKYADKDSDLWFDVKLGNLNSGFKNLDLDKNIFDLKDSRISGLSVKGSLGKPSTDTTSSAPLPTILLKNLKTDNIAWDVDLGEQKTSGLAKFLNLNLDNIDVNALKVENAKISSSFENIVFRSKNVTKTPAGEINFSDLELKNVVLDASNINHSDQKSNLNLEQLSFVEKSGFSLKDARAIASLEGSKAHIDNLELETSASKISSKVELDLDFDNFQNSKFDARIPDLKLGVSEALYFAQSLKQNSTFKGIERDVIRGKGRVFGTFQNLNLDHIYLSAPSSTSLTLNGKVDLRNTLNLDLQIKDLSSSKTDLNKFAGGLPETIELPERLNLNGSIKGSLHNLHALAYLNSTSGGARLDLRLQGVNTKKPAYQGSLHLEDLAAGKIIKNAELGHISGFVNFDGKGFENPDVNFDGEVKEVLYNKEIYQNVALNGNFSNNIATLKGNIHDSKADLSLDVIVNLSQPTITAKGNVNLQSLNLKALGITPENIILKGNFDVNELIADMSRPFVDFRGKNISVYKDSVDFPIGDLSLFTEYGEEEKKLEVKTDFLNLSLSGNFEYNQLQNILLGEINNYFELPSYKKTNDSLSFYFNINGNVEYHPVFTAFVPGLKKFSPIEIKSNLSSDENTPFVGRISIPFLQYDSIQVVNTAFEFRGDGDTLKYRLRTEQVSNESFRIRNASFQGRLRDNLASFDLAVKDSLGKDIHSLQGFMESDGTNIRISFDESGSMLFYKEWGGNPYGYIDYSSKGLVINNVVFSSEGQVLRVNSVSDEPNSPLTVFAEDLDLNFLSRAILQDSTLVSGYLDLNLELAHYFDQESLAFTGEVGIAKFAFNKINLGTLSLEARSDDLKEISIVGNLEGLDNNFDLLGSYYLEKKEPLDFKLDIGKFDFKILEPYLEGIAYDMKGKIGGQIKVTGSPDKPKINGETVFDNLEFRIQETAALLKLDNQKLEIKNSKLLINNWIIKDELKEEMTLKGEIDLSAIPDFTYNFDIGSKNFLIANSQRGQSELFYGKAFIESSLKVKGKNSDFRLTGSLKARENTHLTMLLPDDGFGEDLNSVVTFVDFKKRKILRKNKEESTLSLANAVNINLEIDQNSTINILMNPITNDMLTASGNARLNLGFDNAGDMFIIGRLDVVNGSYVMTYQAIQKRFEITKFSESNIEFSGDPMKGRMNITAEYKVPGRKDISTYPDLSRDKNETFKRTPANLRVDLVLSGEVMQPNVEFQIVVDQADLGSNSDLSRAIQEKGMYIVNDQGVKTGLSEGNLSPGNIESLNQNAIMLLVAGSFTANQIFENLTSSGGGAYEDLARRNASQLISSQLEKYASGLIKGVDINLGLQSSGGALSGDKTLNDRSTNLNVGVSKSLANDRLQFSVGKNFELENKNRRSDEIFDNVEANWLITRDGKYRLRMFRKTQTQSALEGNQVVETGLGLIVGFEYNYLNELWTKKK